VTGPLSARFESAFRRPISPTCSLRRLGAAGPVRRRNAGFLPLTALARSDRDHLVKQDTTSRMQSSGWDRISGWPAERMCPPLLPQA
jgi:hypothetical protein